MEGDLAPRTDFSRKHHSPAMKVVVLLIQDQSQWVELGEEACVRLERG